MQPCQVCGSLSIDTAGYCTQCRTFRGTDAAAGYPASVSPYPNQPAGYPSQVAGYPASTSGYPAGYPGQPTAYPGESSFYGYPRQTSAPPASVPPVSIPPAGPASGGSSGGRGGFVALLTIAVVAVVLVVVAIAVVGVVKKSHSNTDDDGTGGQTQASTDIDQCLIGDWLVSADSQTIPVEGAGSPRFTDQSHVHEVTVHADGSAYEDWRTSRYTAQAAGHTYEIDVTGTLSYHLSSANGTLSFSHMQVHGSFTLIMDGSEIVSDDLSVTNDPVTYTCVGDTWTQHTESEDITLTRR